MFLSRRHLDRRTVLRGLGISLSLPLFDAMVPAQTPLARTAASPRSRLACIEIVHGAAGSTVDGSNKHYWSPAETGTSFSFTESLSPLAPHREALTIITGTDLKAATAWSPGEEGADHFRSSAAFLTAAHPKMTEGADILCGTSIDQIYAAHSGQDTPIPSLQLCIESLDGSGACDYGYACIYSDTISWASSTTPLPMTLDPRMVFESLFGDGSTPAERHRRQQLSGSILDWIASSAAALRKDLGASDRGRLDAYLEDVREIERRIQRIEKFNQSGETRALPAAPAGVPDSYDEHVRLMFDLQALAFMTGVTRVSAFKMSRDVNQRVFPETGVRTSFHSASHHAEIPSKIAEFAKINQYHVGLLAYFLDRLRNTPDGDGTLLDHSLILYGSPMGDSNAHNHKRLPMLLAGHGSGQVRGGLHLRTRDGEPMSNILLTTLRRLGVRIDQIGDSTGELSI